MNDGLRSGEVAAAAGVNVQTLRYYERRGLLDKPDRTPGGHRLYDTETVQVLRVIKAAQRLGFTLTTSRTSSRQADTHTHIVMAVVRAVGSRTGCRRARRRSWLRSKASWRIWPSSGTRCEPPWMPAAMT